MEIHRALSSLPTSYLRSLQDGTGGRMDGAVLVPLTESVTYCLRVQSEAVASDLMVNGMPLFSILNDRDVL